MAHSGAKSTMSIASVGQRGLRAPRHLGLVYGHGQSLLQPWMIAPVRPGESFVGGSIQGETWLNSVINAVQAPMMYAEVGLFYIPLVALGPWFARLITATGDDVEDATSQTASLPGSVDFADSPNEPGLQIGQINWAGEPGDSASSDVAAMKVPLGSRGTYKVAEDFYGLNNYQGVATDARYDNPPQVDPYINGSGRKRIDLQGFADQIPSSSQSLGSLVQSLSLLTKVEVSYADYLAAHGVDPRRSESISMPIMLKHGMLQAQSDPSFVTGFDTTGMVNDAQDDVDTFLETVGGAQAGVVAQSGAGNGWVYGMRPMAAFRRTWKMHRRKAIRFTAPGILLGTVVYWVESAVQTDGGAYFDATRLVNGGLWGDRSLGGIEETDFMAVLDYFPRDGAQDDQSLYNFLNLYVNGDSFAYGANADDEEPFNFLDVSGRVMGVNNHIDVTSKLSAQLYILSDMIG